MKIEIWSDVVCPWCYIGKRNLESALEGFEHRDDVEIEWRSFELDPNAPPLREGDYAGRIGRKYGVPREQAQLMIDRITNAAAEAGLEFHFDKLRGGNTFDAHRVIHLAAEHGKQGEMKERLLHATFTEGEAIGERDTLVRLAVEVGLDAGEVREMLESARFGREVREEEADAHELGATGVPFFVIDRQYGISGAQPPETLRRVIERRWTEAHKATLVMTGDEAPGCEGDSCAV